MGRQLRTTQVANASAVVATTSFPFTADWQKALSAQIIWASTTASATVSLQMSLDNVNWVDVQTPTAIANNSGNVLIDVGTKDAPYLRVQLTFTSGSVTTLSALIANSPR